MIFPFLFPIFIRESKKKDSYPIKLSESSWLTPNGIIDFSNPKELTDVQKTHNAIVDLEIDIAEREFQRREEIARLTGSINMIGRRKIIAIKYGV